MKLQHGTDDFVEQGTVRKEKRAQTHTCTHTHTNAHTHTDIRMHVFTDTHTYPGDFSVKLASMILSNSGIHPH